MFFSVTLPFSIFFLFLFKLSFKVLSGPKKKMYKNEGKSARREGAGWVFPRPHVDVFQSRVNVRDSVYLGFIVVP